MTHAKPTEASRAKNLAGQPRQKSLAFERCHSPNGVRIPRTPTRTGVVGKQFWDSIFDAGEIWISIRTDTELVQLVCEQLDRRELIKEQIQADPTDPVWFRQANEIEKQIVASLSLLGFTPADRTRLGLVSAKTKSKLEELLAKKAQRG